MATVQSIARTLEAIAGKASFVSQRSASAADLALDVKGFGRVRLPVSPTTARQLIKLAQPALHGYKDETRLDRRVRDTFEINGRQLSIDEEAWQRRLQLQLEHLRHDLGLPEGRRLRAELHNLLIYGPGQFFVSHQDSEKNDAMVASLVVGLPSTFSGGAMIIEHHGEKTTVRGSATRLGFTAFYADCQHQVQPVKQGYRLALTYNLLLEGEAEPEPAPSGAVAALSASVREYFATPLPPRWKGNGDRATPDRLIYLLDHQYTQRGLDWTRLKGTDGQRVAALQVVAAEQDCEACLALIDVHEVWNCGGGFDDGWREHRYRDECSEDEDEDEEDDEPDVRGHELTDLIDGDATLRHLTGGSGKAPAMPAEVDPREICHTKPSVELEPYESEYEGFMGNYGNTMERWYHRAAVVIWPRRRAFALRAKVEPRWALGEIAETLKSCGRAAAVEQAGALKPFWAQAVRRADDNRLFERTLGVAAELETPALAEALLAPFSLLQLKNRSASCWLRSIERYGLAWGKAVLAHWQPPAHSADHERLAWTATQSSEVCQALRAAADGCALARIMLQQQWEWLRAQWRTRGRIDAISARDDALAELGRPLLGLLQAALTIDQSEVQNAIVATLASTEGDMPSTPALALALLRAAQTHPNPTASSALVSLREHWRRRLEALLAEAPRRENDWSITQSLNCRCKFCGELGGFLRDATRIRHEWPLAEAHRKHLHCIIDTHGVPLTHTTRRSGRPYVLVLEKTRALFAREAAKRSAWQLDLDWLLGVSVLVQRNN